MTILSFFRMSAHSRGHRCAVFEASDVATSYELFRSNKPDVVIIDLSMRGVGLAGLSLVRRIREDDRHIPILVLSMHRDPSLVSQALQAGAVGYVLKDTATEDLLTAIQEVQRGNRYLSHSLAIEVALPASDRLEGSSE